MKKLFIASLLSLLSVYIFGQNDSISYEYKGVIINSITNKIIPFAIIGIHENAEKDAIKFHTADSSGNFSFKISEKGNYILRFNAIGFKPKDIYTDDPENNQLIDLKEIKLDPVDETLEEVVITEEKPLIRTESDKIIYNSEADPDADNSTALEMLRKVPLVSVDGEDNIRLKGKTDFKIFMNGKESSFTKNNPSEFLKSLPASSIKEIEIITSPGAKYDAEGTGGIINIITHEKKINGYMLNVNLNATSLKRLGSGVSLTAGIGKFVVSTRIFGGYRSTLRNTSESTNENFYSDLMHFNELDSYADVYGNNLWGTASMSYEFDSLNLISGECQFWHGNYNADNFSTSRILTAEEILYQAYNSHNITQYKYGGQSGNIDYQRTSKKNKDEVLTLSYKFDNYPNSRETEQITDSVINFYNEQYRLINTGKSNENTFQIDYVQPFFEFLKAEIGSKYIMRRNSSLSEEEIYNFSNSLYEDNPDEYLDFSHNQDIIAGYLSLNGNIKKFGYKTGLRVERSITNGYFKPETISDFSNKSFEFVPSCSFSFQFGKMNSVQAGYSKRIQRPGIWYLNPYIDDTNPKYIRYGNPNLTSEWVHSFYWNMYLFTKPGSISFGTYYDITENGIGSIYYLQDEDIIHETFENIIQKTTYGINFNANLRLFKKLNLNTNITTDYNIMENQNDPSQNNTSWGSYSYMSAGYSFMKSFNLSAYGGLYSFPGGLQRSSYLYYYQGISLKKSFLKDKLSLTISGNNVFWKNMVMNYDIEDDNFHQTGNYTRPARNFRIAISYKLGEMNTGVKKAKRGIQNTDVKSGNDNNDQGGN